MDISNQIRTRRTAMGLSQDELARKICVSRQTISNWETDRTYPDVQSLLLLSNLFGTTIDVLVKGDLQMMNETIQAAVSDDALRMKRMTVWMHVGTLVALAVGVAGYVLLKPWGWLLFLVPYAVVMVAALRIERIKRANDVQTYREIVAFMNGEPVDKSRFHDQTTAQKVGANLLKLLMGALVGAGTFVIVLAIINAVS